MNALDAHRIVAISIASVHFSFNSTQTYRYITSILNAITNKDGGKDEKDDDEETAQNRKKIFIFHFFLCYIMKISRHLHHYSFHLGSIM